MEVEGKLLNRPFSDKGELQFGYFPCISAHYDSIGGRKIDVGGSSTVDLRAVRQNSYALLPRGRLGHHACDHDAETLVQSVCIHCRVPLSQFVASGGFGSYPCMSYTVEVGLTRRANSSRTERNSNY